MLDGVNINMSLRQSGEWLKVLAPPVDSFILLSALEPGRTEQKNKNITYIKSLLYIFHLENALYIAQIWTTVF